MILKSTHRGFVLGLSLAALLLAGCASSPHENRDRQEIWMTYAQNVPHATDQRAGIFRTSEQPAVILSGFAGRQVVLSLHEGDGQRLIERSTQNITRSPRYAVRLSALPPGRYVVRASEDGVLKAETYFIVR